MTTAVSNVSLTSAPSPPVVNGSLNSTNTYYFGFVGKFSTNTRSTFEAQAKRQSPKARELLLVLETLSGRTIATHQKKTQPSATIVGKPHRRAVGFRRSGPSKSIGFYDPDHDATLNPRQPRRRATREEI